MKAQVAKTQNTMYNILHENGRGSVEENVCLEQKYFKHAIRPRLVLKNGQSVA